MCVIRLKKLQGQTWYNNLKLETRGIDFHSYMNLILAHFLIILIITSVLCIHGRIWTSAITNKFGYFDGPPAKK